MTARRLALSLAISFTVLLLPAMAQAAGCSGDTWYGPGGNGSEAKSGEWGEKSNWSTDTVPVKETQVCITVPGTYTVTLIPYPDTHYAGDDGGAAEKLTVGATSGTQTLKVMGEAHGFEGDWYNVTTLQVGHEMTVGPHGVLALEATESDAPNQTGGGSGSSVLFETDTSGQPGHPFVLEGGLLAGTSSSKYGDEIHSHSLTNDGSFQVASGTLKLYNEEPSISTGSIVVSPGATLLQERSSSFTNEGVVENSGTTIFTGFNTKEKWIQGTHGSIGGNPVVIEAGGGLEESAGSGPGDFTFGANGGGYLLGTIPKGQTITLASSTGQTTLFLGNHTLINEGTLHLDVPPGSEGNTNIEEGTIVNKGTIDGTVEGAKAKNVIDVPLTNEPGGVLTVGSGTLFDNRTLTNNGLIQIAPSSILELVATMLVNSAGGTIAPQISSASTFGKIDLAFHGEIEAGGTLAPTLTNGFTPSVGEEFHVIEGSPVKGTFAAVSGGFTPDYAHESSESPYVGVVYGSAPPPPGTTGTTSKTAKTAPAKAKLAKVTVSGGRVSVDLTCPKNGGACGKTTVRVTVAEHLEKHGRAITKVVVVASGAVSLKAGAKATLKLRINSVGKALLRKHHSLRGLLTVIQGSRKVTSAKVTLKR